MTASSGAARPSYSHYVEMSNNKGLRRALSPKRSLRLEAQGSEGSGLNRLSFTGSKKRTRKQSKLQTTGVAQDVDPQVFFEEWKITPQEEVRIAASSGIAFLQTANAATWVVK